MGLTKREKRQRERRRDAEAGGKGQTKREKARDIREGKEEKQREVKQKPTAVQPSPAIDLRAMEPGKVMKPGETAPIKLKPKEKEKTGISKLREEDSVIGTAVRVATDWKTTVALVATLATIGTLGAGAGVTAGMGRGVITRTATIGGKTMTTQRAIIGKPAVSGVDKLFRAGANFAVNTKSRALTTSMLTKSGMSVGVSHMLLAAGIVSTYPFSHFELAEATDKIGIAIFKAAEAGDLEETERLLEYLEEMVNPDVWDSILNKIPFANIYNNVSKNIAAALVSANSIVQSTQKKVEAAQAKAEEPTFEEKRIAGEEKARERELERREEDEEYWEEQREESAERKADERLANEKYWDDIYRKHEKRKADEREADEAYWAKIKGAALDDEDKKIIDDWNKGRSALNFKWLGI